MKYFSLLVITLLVTILISYQDSCAEVKLQDGSLVYWEAGSGGRVELKAVKPGEALFPVAIEHFIKFGK